MHLCLPRLTKFWPKQHLKRNIVNCYTAGDHSFAGTGKVVLTCFCPKVQGVFCMHYVAYCFWFGVDWLSVGSDGREQSLK